jgi:uncharacterized protein (DUF2336 family)
MSAIVERFLNWADGAPALSRADAASALARAFLHSPLSAEERDDVETALTVLLDDPAMDVRLALAAVLAPSGRAPHHVILTLAGDKDPVAAVVAEHSPLILDSELVDMVATRSEPIQLAIARRPFLSRSVAAAIAEVGVESACVALLCNPGARMLRFSLDRIVARHGDRAEVRSTLLERDDLPIEIRHVLMAKLGDALRDLVVGREWMRAGRVEAAIRDARECATIAAAFEAPADTMPDLIVELMQAGELTPAFLIRTVAAGQAYLFEAGLAALSAVPRERVTSLIASGRSSSLTALLHGAGLPKDTFPAFAAAIDLIRTGDSLEGALSDYRRATRLIDAIVARCQERQDRELNEILALLRRFARDAKRIAARDHAEQLRAA